MFDEEDLEDDDQEVKTKHSVPPKKKRKMGSVSLSLSLPPSLYFLPAFYFS